MSEVKDRGYQCAVAEDVFNRLSGGSDSNGGSSQQPILIECELSVNDDPDEFEIFELGHTVTIADGDVEVLYERLLAGYDPNTILKIQYVMDETPYTRYCSLATWSYYETSRDMVLIFTDADYGREIRKVELHLYLDSDQHIATYNR